MTVKKYATSLVIMSEQGEGAEITAEHGGACSLELELGESTDHRDECLSCHFYACESGILHEQV